VGAFDPLNPSPELYRDYLCLLARLRLNGRAVGIVAPSDIVQDTLLRPHKRREQFRGDNEVQYRAYLRQILANVIADVFRDAAHEDKICHALGEYAEFIAGTGAAEE
jgi:DNA-directed RNA polymerase specialized sigma24 family protein